MKQRFLIAAALCAFLATSCMKEDDFSALGHPIDLQGDFDPVLGFPIAKMSADMNTIVGMLHTSENVTVYVDSETDLVAFRYQDTFTFDYSYEQVKSKRFNGAKGDYGDSIVLDCQLLEGTTKIDLFEKLNEIGNGNIEAKGMYVTLDADMHTRVSDNVLALIDHGVQAFFDCDTMFITLQNGEEWTVGLGRSLGRVNVKDLVQGKRVNIFDSYDVSFLVNLKPVSIRYYANLYLVAPPDLDFITCAQYINDSLYIDGLTTQMNAYVDFPLQLYCSDLAYYDTIELDLNQMDSLLAQADQYMTLNDTNNKLVFVAENSLPLSLSLNAVCLDENYHPISQPLIQRDSLLNGAPIKPYGYTDSYSSNGSTKSNISIPLTRDILDKLARARYLQFSLGVNTSTQGATEEKPTVMVLGKDRLNLKLYMQLAPHIHL